jgi:hypothetical protein
MSDSDSYTRHISKEHTGRFPYLSYFCYLLSEAYEVIGDEDKRKQYDAYGSAGSGNPLLRQLKDNDMMLRIVFSTVGKLYTYPKVSCNDLILT